MLLWAELQSKATIQGSCAEVTQPLIDMAPSSSTIWLDGHFAPCARIIESNYSHAINGNNAAIARRGRQDRPDKADHTRHSGEQHIAHHDVG